MKGKKNLERAIVLGLLLSTSVYGSAWAEISGSIQTFRPSNQDFELKWDYGDKSGENAIQGISQKNSFDTAISVSSNGEQGFHNVDVELDFDKLEINIGHESNIGSGNNFLSAIMTDGYNKDITADLSINSDGAISITAKSKNNYSVLGVWAKSDDSIKLNSKNGDVTVNVTKTAGSNLSYKDGGEEDRTLHAVYGLNASNDRNAASYDPNDESRGSEINITTDNGSISVTAKNESKDLNGSHIYAAANDNGHLILSAGQGADYTGTGSISLKAESNRNNNVYGLDTWGGEENRLTADEIFISAKAENGNAYGVKLNGGTTENYYDSEYNEITGESINGEAYGVLIEGNSSINIHGGDNFISGAAVASPEKGFGIKAINSDAFIKGDNNYFNVDSNTGAYISNGQGFAVSIENTTGIEEQQYHEIAILANESNIFSGAVYAKGNGASVKIEGEGNNVVTNNFYSASVIENAGNLDTSDGSKFEGKQVVSALYAENGAKINLTGENYIGTWADNEDEDTLERTVWAYDEGGINITGAVQLKTDEYASSPNSADVAVAAGTATGLTHTMVDEFDGTRAEVNIKYDDFTGERTSSSYIEGDILSAYAGLVSIDSDNENAGINITGNLLAGNNGILNVDLGKGGTLIGRADDYGDAGNNDGTVDESGNKGHQNYIFYNPEFSSDIYKGGRVDLTMGEGSTWYVTGQSWITTIDTSGANGENQDTRATIDLKTYYVKDAENDTTSAHALTVYQFNGDADFKMNLTGDRSESDMLYMKSAKGDYRILLDDVITSDEIKRDHDGTEFSGLRFATVGNENSQVRFSVGSYDTGGAFNVDYVVDTDEYGSAETLDENIVYNGEGLSNGKPGNDTVNDFFASSGTPVNDTAEGTSGIALMSLNAEDGIMLLDAEEETVANESKADNSDYYNATNYKIIDRTETLSDTGETILNMSRANYSNAIYMDRLNKRLGEARYINGEEDEGMWVRIRHDRIGKDDAYRSQNTMYELGYDKKQNCNNGERRVGFAVDYMHGDTGYTDIAGKGEIDRYGLWLYDTWMGDKGHYVDYVAKWGHLSNDFEVYTMNDKTKQVTGDYSNNVFSVSAEYGRKKDIGNDWYFEPQAQLQLARVTGADYTTNQGTKVSVDGINSLIGRAGFRIGKDFGEEKQSTLYFKADVLHEFLGDQDVYVMDKSTDNKWAGISYDNEGTWYDIGIGYAAMMSKSSYAFIDLEQSFGNDNDDTYQINVGMQWSF